MKIKFFVKLKKMKNSLNSIFPWILIIFGLGLVSFLIWGVNHPYKLAINSAGSSSTFSLKEPANILFLGVAGDGSKGALLTDSIFLVHLNLNQKKVSIISFPRDLWVQVPSSSHNEKINALYALNNKNTTGFIKATSYNLIQEKIETITGLKINYVVIFDLQGFGKLVDALGGINIWLDKEMIDPNLTNPYDSSEIFDLSPGWHYLDGATAIKFVRTRYAPNGDFYRMDNQHIIIAALREKINQLSSVWNLMTWFKIWQSMSNHYIANLDFNILLELFNLFKNIKSNQIQYLSLTNRPPDNLLISSAVEGIYNNATTSIYVLLPKEGFEHYQQIKEYIQNTINQ
ncbi:MAG: LCP family protein [Candidatus Paceibacterota bacterium]|jgi:LCP family protein required for cell wall assembly